LVGETGVPGENSLTTGNMVPGLARAREMTTNLEIFEQCRNSEDNFIAKKLLQYYNFEYIM
jgi:hypothetical protein